MGFVLIIPNNSKNIFYLYMALQTAVLNNIQPEEEKKKT